MKKLNTNILISLILLTVLISSCAKNSLTMGVLEPAPVNVPSNIKKAAILNRSEPAENRKKIDKLDKILSLEGKNLDKEGAQKSVEGLKDELSANDRFTEVKVIEAEQIENPGLGVYPAALPWNKVSQICQDNDVDAIFTLSFYDTDANVDYKAEKVQIPNPLGINIPAIEHTATINTIIKTGWRIYDPANKLILDEYIMNERVVSSGKGINPAKAAEAIMGRKEQVLDVSNNLGHNYAARILPYRVRVRREYYVRGSNNFKMAKRRAQTGNWDGAAELWEKETTSSKRKVAGRAWYNMAIYNEINGDLDRAIEFASRAYTDYRIKYALQYVNILENRIARNNRLQQQMDY
jgi:hypothetical protein